MYQRMNLGLFILFVWTAGKQTREALKYAINKSFPMYSINNLFSSFSLAMYSLHPPLTWFVQKLHNFSTCKRWKAGWVLGTEQGYSLTGTRFVLNSIFGFIIPVPAACFYALLYVHYDIQECIRTGG